MIARSEAGCRQRRKYDHRADRYVCVLSRGGIERGTWWLVTSGSSEHCKDLIEVYVDMSGRAAFAASVEKGLAMVQQFPEGGRESSPEVSKKSRGKGARRRAD